MTPSTIGELRARVADMQEKLLRFSVDHRAVFNGEHTTGTLLALEARQVIGALNSELLDRRPAGLGTVSVEITDAMVAAAMTEFVASIRKQDPDWADESGEEGEILLTSPNGDYFALEFPIRDAVKSCLTSIGVEAEDYVVWSNEHRCWWGPNNCGYTKSLLTAGRYSRRDALDIAKGSRNGWTPEGNPDEIAVPLRDAEFCLPEAFKS